jgi:hypothetical protein
MSARPHPAGSLRLFGLDNRSLDLWLSAGLIVIVIGSRAAAFPISIWEQDEALFAGALLDFDPTDNLPHPPWFPLWVGIGKLVHLVGIDAARALQWVSVVFSIWILFPLTTLWSELVPRHLAVGGAVLFLFAPGPWFFSGRAFCGTAATALLVAALAFWLGDRDRSNRLAMGSVLAALAVLVRPHFFPAAIATLVIVALKTPARSRARLLVAFLIPVALGAAVFIAVSGGPSPLWSALETHAEYHFSRLGDATHGLADSGLARSLGHPAAAVVWLVLFHIGMIAIIHRHGWAEISPILVGGLLPLLVVVQVLSNPAHARYSVPMLALTGGLVVAGLEVVVRRWTWPVIGAAAAAAVVLIGPDLADYRSSTSPPIAAVDEAIVLATMRGGVVVADRTLYSFFVLRGLERPIGVPVLYDHMIELGHAPPPPPGRAVYVFDHGNGGLMETTEQLHTFVCSIPVVERLAQDRFIDLRVASGAALRGRSDPDGPLVLID